MAATPSVLSSVTSCARCGGNHTGLPLKQFERPPEWGTAWATCPTTGDPILVHIQEDA